MRKRCIALCLCALLCLTGCGSFLEREYSTREPHTSRYYESGEGSILRAENYQDIVNDLLVLIGSGAKNGTIWVYEGEKLPDAAKAAEKACHEVQKETPLGSYAVDYLSYTVDDTPRNYTVLQMSLGYRRTAEQIAGIVHVTNLSALTDLLGAAVTNDAPELVVQLSYFDETEDEVRRRVGQVRRELRPEQKEPWEVHLYPKTGEAGIIEILLKG